MMFIPMNGHFDECRPSHEAIYDGGARMLAIRTASRHEHIFIRLAASSPDVTPSVDNITRYLL